MKLDALQAAIFQTLTGNAALANIAKAVWIPQAPQAADGALDTPFPYLAIPAITPGEFDTKSDLGINALVQIDGYSRIDAGGDLQISVLASAVYFAMHRAPLTIETCNWITTEHETTSFGYEDGGQTRRFVSLYRVMYEI